MGREKHQTVMLVLLVLLGVILLINQIAIHQLIVQLETPTGLVAGFSSPAQQAVLQGEVLPYLDSTG